MINWCNYILKVVSIFCVRRDKWMKNNFSFMFIYNIKLFKVSLSELHLIRIDKILLIRHILY